MVPTVVVVVPRRQRRKNGRFVRAVKKRAARSSPRRRRTHKRSVTHTARRKRTGGRRGGGGRRGFKGILNGGIGGAAEAVVGPKVPLPRGSTTAAVGYFMKDDFLEHLGGYQIGQGLASGGFNLGGAAPAAAYL